jgi:hypothetical protein
VPWREQELPAGKQSCPAHFPASQAAGLDRVATCDYWDGQNAGEPLELDAR